MYMRNRWYDPTTAQFLTRDPLDALTLSAYGYAHGDPVNGSDPTGLCPASPSSPAACPAWAKSVVQFLGVGDIFRLGWDIVHGGPISSDARGSGLSVTEQVALSFLKKYAKKHGVDGLAAFLVNKYSIPSTIIATIIDAPCTTIDRNSALNK
jgi:uncharacterized protein RhaS with RHS repeats